MGEPIYTCALCDSLSAICNCTKEQLSRYCDVLSGEIDVADMDLQGEKDHANIAAKMLDEAGAERDKYQTRADSLAVELVEVCELFIVQHRYLKLKGAIVGPSPAVDDAQAILDREKEMVDYET